MAMIAKSYEGNGSYRVQKAEEFMKTLSEKAEYYTDTEHGVIYFEKPNKSFEGVTYENYKNVFVINGTLYIASTPNVHYKALRIKERV